MTRAEELAASIARTRADGVRFGYTLRPDERLHDGPRDPHMNWPYLRITRREFEALPEYSTSLPTGTYPGKRWRALKTVVNPGEPKVRRWYVGEYGPVSDEDGLIDIRWAAPRIIL